LTTTSFQQRRHQSSTSAFLSNGRIPVFFNHAAHPFPLHSLGKESASRRSLLRFEKSSFLGEGITHPNLISVEVGIPQLPTTQLSPRLPSNLPAASIRNWSLHYSRVSPQALKQITTPLTVNHPTRLVVFNTPSCFPFVRPMS
jgi:hypothetical protein